MFIIIQSGKPKKNFDKSWYKYKRSARNLVNQVISNKFGKYGFKYNRIAIRNQKTRWGSCSSKKNLNFNYRIIFLPLELAEYLVAHELCHLKELNHSKKYWTLMSEMIPNYRKYQQQLKKLDMNKLD